MTEPAPPTLGRTEYFALCEVLGVEPLADPIPPKRTAHLPAWAQMPMIATQAARTKLSAWALKTPRERWDDTPSPTDVLVQMTHTFVGDVGLMQYTAQVLCELPRPVRDYIVPNVTFIAAGMRVGGFCGPVIHQGHRPFTIVLSASHQTSDGVRSLIAHEIGHGWLLPEQPEQTAMGALMQATLLEAPLVPAEHRALVDRERARDEVDERQVRELTRCWGFPDV